MHTTMLLLHCSTCATLKIKPPPPPTVKNIDVYAILKRFNEIIQVIVSSKSLDLLNQQNLIPKNTNETKNKRLHIFVGEILRPCPTFIDCVISHNLLRGLECQII